VADPTAFEALHNSVVQTKWAELCVCNPAPNAPPQSGPVQPGVQVCGISGVNNVCNWVYEIPGNVVEVAISVTGETVSGVAQSQSTNAVDMCYSTTPFTTSTPVSSISGVIHVNWHQSFPFTIDSGQFDLPNGDHIYLGFAPLTSDPNTCFNIQPSWQTPAQPTPPAPPTAPPLPTGVPAAPGCPTVTDNQGLANMLCDVESTLAAINAKLDYLARNINPPTANPDPTPTPAPPNTPITKPPAAVGCIVQLTSLPPGTPDYGSPGFIPDMAWAVMMTDYGPLPSVLVKHNPMVLIFPTPLVTTVQIDARPGVTAQVQFLNAPK